MAELHLPQIDELIKDRFWSKITKMGPDDCWHWGAYRNPRGYGIMGFTRDGIKLNFIATHIALFIDGRPRPKGKIALHSCDKPSCCNPKHLRWGTHVENEADKKERGRLHPTWKRRQTMLTRAARGERQACAKLTEAQVRVIRRDSRSCAAIARDYAVGTKTISDIRLRKTWRHC